MRSGIVKKRADGSGAFQTVSIYVKYPPMSLLPFCFIIGGYSFLLVTPCLPPCFVCLFGQSLRLSLACLASLSAMLVEINNLFQLLFKYFHIFHCNILYFIYYHLLILPSYTFLLSIAFFYIYPFPFISIIHSLLFLFISSIHCTGCSQRFYILTA